MSDARVPDVLQRDFCAAAPNQKWATDVSELNVNGDQRYLSGCMDLCNGELAGASSPRFSLPNHVLRIGPETALFLNTGRWSTLLRWR